MNIDTQTSQLVANFASHEGADRAIKELSKAHFEMRDLSIVGRDYHTEEQPIGYINTGERMLTWGKLGAFWGSIWGILFGSAVIFVPGLGSVVLAGWLVTTLAGAIEGAVVGGGIGAIGAALSRIGVPENSVIAYQDAIRAGKFLVIVRGTVEEIDRAKTILGTLGAESLEVSDQRILAAV
jgi:uncharacterized membrane protein